MIIFAYIVDLHSRFVRVGKSIDPGLLPQSQLPFQLFIALLRKAFFFMRREKRLWNSSGLRGEGMWGVDSIVLRIGRRQSLLPGKNNQKVVTQPILISLWLASLYNTTRLSHTQASLYNTT